MSGADRYVQCGNSGRDRALFCLLSKSSLIKPVWDTCCECVQTCTLNCHIVSVGRAKHGHDCIIAKILKEKLEKPFQISGAISPPTHEGGLMCHSLNTKTIFPPFSQHTLLTYVKGWEHTILSKMDVAAWDQSTHLLFVQLFFFFFQSPEAWRRQGALKMFCKCPDSRCGRSKSEQRELKHTYVC